MFFSTSVAILGLASAANAHMIMNTPVPYGKSSLNNSPLNADGSDFPCKMRGADTFAADGANNVMALGSSQPLLFTGSAVHGGGSCQISITYTDTASINKNTVWKVIHSIEGGCPMEGAVGNNGNDASQPSPSTYSFTIPNDIPTGTATLAWTWFNKIGNREMYMNCAPITITAGSSKRDEFELEARNATMLMERDQAAFNALPDMFVANIDATCKTVDNTDLKFPNPGDSLEQLGLQTSSALSTPTGTGCQQPGASPAAGDSGSGSGSGSGSVAASAVVTTAPKATLPGGVFATVAPVSSTPAAAPAPAATSVAPAVAPSVAPVAAPSSPSASVPVTTGSGGVMTAGSACSSEGMWNCIGGTSFQRCASGMWSVVQPLASGTTCTAGQSMAITIGDAKLKRSVRFSNEHVRRHVRRSS